MLTELFLTDLGHFCSRYVTFNPGSLDLHSSSPSGQGGQRSPARKHHVFDGPSAPEAGLWAAPVTQTTHLALTFQYLSDVETISTTILLSHRRDGFKFHAGIERRFLSYLAKACTETGSNVGRCAAFFLSRSKKTRRVPGRQHCPVPSSRPIIFRGFPILLVMYYLRAITCLTLVNLFRPRPVSKEPGCQPARVFY